MSFCLFFGFVCVPANMLVNDCDLMIVASMCVNDCDDCVNKKNAKTAVIACDLSD